MKYSIIPAAGLATRFLPASKAIPKELFPILDKPVIQYIVEEAVSAGVSGIVFVSGSGKEAILDHFDRLNPKFPVSKLKDEIRSKVTELDSMIDVLSIRQKDPLGLGHAVLKGAYSVRGESFAVLLPDMLVIPKGKITSMKKMVELHENTGFSVIALMKVPDEMKHMYGIAEGVKISENIIEIKKLFEKPSKEETISNLAIVGRYIFNPEIVEILGMTNPGKGGEIQLTDAITELLAKQKVLGLVIDDDSIVFDTGNMEGFALANTYMALKRIPEFREKAESLLEENIVPDNKKFDERPWGWWKTLEQKKDYKVKHIFVSPGEKLSLQTHKYRSEIWIIAHGSGLVTIGETIHNAEKGSVFHIEKGDIHRAEGGESGLDIIEIQTGDYLGEDDIIRLDDKYGRN